MNKLILIFSFMFFNFLCSPLFAQLDTILAKKIDSLKIEDQRWRNLITEFNNGKQLQWSKEELVRNMIETDSLNHFYIKSIFYEFGFPGIDKVGSQSSHNFWLLIQHQDSHVEFQGKVLASM